MKRCDEVYLWVQELTRYDKLLQAMVAVKKCAGQCNSKQSPKWQTMLTTAWDCLCLSDLRLSFVAPPTIAMDHTGVEMCEVNPFQNFGLVEDLSRVPKDLPQPDIWHLTNLWRQFWSVQSSLVLPFFTSPLQVILNKMNCNGFILLINLWRRGSNGKPHSR